MKEFILLPRFGFKSKSMLDLEPQPGASGSRRALPGAATTRDRIDVLDSIAEDGPKVAMLESAQARRMSEGDSEMIALPVRTYTMARRRRRQRRSMAAATGTSHLRFTLVDAIDGTAIEDALVIAITDTDANQGASARSRANGKVTLTFPGAVRPALEEFFIYTDHTHWGRYLSAGFPPDGAKIPLQRIDPAQPDFLQTLIGAGGSTPGKGVRVGVVDSGVANHPELNVVGGGNFASDSSDPGDYGAEAGDDGHGTHVAGTIAGRAARGAGIRGVAPGVELFSYRVFPHDGGRTSNVRIMKAINRAVADACDIINLSLGGGAMDEALNRAIGYAFDNGVLCIVAAGNDGREPVSYPAWYKRSIAVSAIGDRATFPDDSSEVYDIQAPNSAIDPNRFAAKFTNIGTEIDLCGPGVGIVSTYPGGRYAAMSGTSMACPAVAGKAAALLSENDAIRNMPRDRRRAQAIATLIRDAANDAGFPTVFQGFGLPL